MKFIGNTVVTFLLLFIVVISMSCDDETPLEDKYYVKYEIIAKSIYTTTRYATINFENNTSTTFKFGSSSWETTIGPVKKGFDAKIIGGYTSQTISNSYTDVKIYISKNNGPFALKKFDISDKTRTLVEMNYTIDF